MLLLLEKLAFASTKAVADTVLGFDGFVDISDGEIMKMIKDLTNFGLEEAFEVPEVSLAITKSMGLTFNRTYESDQGLVDVGEYTINFDVVANPTRSSIVMEIFNTPDEVQKQLNKLGYKCSVLLMKKKESNKEKAWKRKNFKPRSSISTATINRHKRNTSWIPEPLKLNRNEIVILPAVIIT